MLLILSCSGSREPSSDQISRFARGKSLYFNDSLEESLDIFTVLYDEIPSFRENAERYARALQYTGRPEEAAAVREVILEDGFYYIDTVKALSRYYIESERFGEAAAMLEAALTYSSEDPTLLFLLARTHARQDEFDRALSLLSGAEAIMERQVEIPLETASLYQRYGFYEKAVSSITRCIAFVGEESPLLPALMRLMDNLEKETDDL